MASYNRRILSSGQLHVCVSEPTVSGMRPTCPFSYVHGATIACMHRVDVCLRRRYEAYELLGGSVAWKWSLVASVHTHYLTTIRWIGTMECVCLRRIRSIREVFWVGPRSVEVGWWRPFTRTTLLLNLRWIGTMEWYGSERN
jgi:hypothetical protein